MSFFWPPSECSALWNTGGTTNLWWRSEWLNSSSGSWGDYFSRKAVTATEGKGNMYIWAVCVDSLCLMNDARVPQKWTLSTCLCLWRLRNDPAAVPAWLGVFCDIPLTLLHHQCLSLPSLSPGPKEKYRLFFFSYRVQNTLLSKFVKISTLLFTLPIKWHIQQSLREYFTHSHGVAASNNIIF